MYSFTSNEIKPTGWLKTQLEIQANGLSGNLDKIWPDIRDSKWIGGECEGWERVPYWLDGFIPLAYLLDNSDMKDRAKKYIDAILARQKADGWICPCTDEERGTYDVWAAILILKVLVVYFECTEDNRIEKAVKDAVYCLNKHLDTYKLYDWGKFRWFECLDAVKWLYDRTHDNELLEFTKKLKAQGFDYTAYFTDWQGKEPQNKWTFETHVVNTGMAFKGESLYQSLLGTGNGNTEARDMYAQVFKYHGAATGHFTGDECLSGVSPIQGSELCGVAEAMYSYETLLRITEDPFWGDLLEKTAFNSFPATNSEDMWTHQYDQQINQTSCVKQFNRRIFRTNGGDSNLFGLEPNFGCCTANMNQAFPKLALSAFMRTDKGICSAVLVPSVLNTEINSTKVTVKLETEYPFRNILTYKISTQAPVSFELSVRLPEWAKVFIDGSEIEITGFYKIEKEFSGEQTIQLQLKSEPVLRQSPSGMYHLENGALVYSIPIQSHKKMYEYTKNNVERKFPYCDYELYPVSKWNYAFLNDEFEVIENEYTNPFSRANPPVIIKTSVVEIPWGTQSGFPYICAQQPLSCEPISDPIEIELQPYGCTYLRMTDMPITEIKKETV